MENNYSLEVLTSEELDDNFINSLLNTDSPLSDFEGMNAQPISGSSPSHISSSDMESVSSPSEPVLDEAFFNDPSNFNFNLESFDPSALSQLSQQTATTSDLGMIKTETLDLSSSGERRGQKRPRHENDVDVSSVSLTREQLLKFSSEELTHYFKDMGRHRKFSSAEEKEIRRQRRLVKNRESAQNSRLKKKNLMEDLERKIEVLEDEKRKMASEIVKLRHENKMLLDEVKTLRSGHSKAPMTSYTKGKGTSLPLSVSTKTHLPASAKTTTTAILIFLFAFSLYFSASNYQPQAPFPSYLREPIPEVAPAAGLPVYEKIREARSRKLLEVEETSSIYSPDSSPYSSPLSSSPSSSSPSVNQHILPSTNSSKSLIPVIHSHQVEDHSVNLWMKVRNQKYPNMVYFKTNNLQQIIPPENEQSDQSSYPSDSPFILSLFVPNSLEITCQVLDVKNISTIQQPIHIN